MAASSQGKNAGNLQSESAFAVLQSTSPTPPPPGASHHQTFYQSRKKSSWLVKKNHLAGGTVEVKFAYRLSTNQLQDILFHIVD